MDKKMLTIVLAVVLIGCFFLAYFGSASGLDFVKAPGGDWKKYVPALIPLSGIMLLIGAMNNGNYPGGRGIWSWLPLLTILFMVIGLPLIDGAAIGDIFKMLGKGYGIGFWITIVASLVLAFYNPQAKA
jgi:FtsH-binding integral membrane protein